MFPLHFLFADPHLGYKSPLAHAVVRVEPSLSLPSLNLLAVVPTPILTVLNSLPHHLQQVSVTFFLYQCSSPDGSFYIDWFTS